MAALFALIRVEEEIWFLSYNVRVELILSSAAYEGQAGLCRGEDF